MYNIPVNRAITVVALLILFIIVVPVNAFTGQSSTSNPKMHPSWDLDGDNLNDCELDGSCDHTIDYRKPRISSASPSYDCTVDGLNSAETLICNDAQLSVFDRKLAQIYGNARYKAHDTMLPTLTAEQRGWLKGRDDCWKEEDQRQCVLDSYVVRIAELQASFRLVDHTGPLHYVCGESKANEVVITFFQTLPKTLIAERGDSVSLMYEQQDRETGRYSGRNEHLVIDGNRLRLVWGYQEPELTCYEN